MDKWVISSTMIARVVHVDIEGLLVLLLRLVQRRGSLDVV